MQNASRIQPEEYSKFCHFLKGMMTNPVLMQEMEGKLLQSFEQQ